MSIKEKLLQIQHEGEDLANRIDQKRTLEELKHQFTQSAHGGEHDSKLKQMFVDTGLLDMLSEAVDIIPFVRVVIPKGSIIPNSFGIMLQWDEKGHGPESKRPHSFKELKVEMFNDTVNIYSALFVFPQNRDREEMFIRDD